MGDRPRAAPVGLLELTAAGFVVVGLALIWIPLALIGTGLAFAAAAVAAERSEAARVAAGAADAALNGAEPVRVRRMV